MEDHDWCNKPLICPICNEEAVWHNMVNITNGSWDEEGKRIDGYIELKEKKKISGICSCCGAEHVCEINYEIPKNKK
jgi:transcription elongation factor Elf1